MRSAAAECAETFQVRFGRWLEVVTEGHPADLPVRRDHFSGESMELAHSQGATSEAMLAGRSNPESVVKIR